MKRTANNKEPQIKGKESGKVLLLLCVVVIAVMAVVIVVLLLRKEQPGEAVQQNEPRRNVVVTESNVEEAAAQLAEEDFVEPGYYTVNMVTEWHFSSGDAISSDARVDNLLGNTNPVYFDVFLEGQEDEPVYCSPVIPVGSFLEHIALDKPLDAGTYDCVMVYHLVDEEQNTISTLRVKFKITVDS